MVLPFHFMAVSNFMDSTHFIFNMDLLYRLLSIISGKLYIPDI